MSISSFLQSVFGFRTVPTTVFLILIYVAAFVSLYVTDQLPAVPAVDKQHGYGVDLEAAYKDLHLIAARPHPYNSYENDRVRAYVLDRVSQIAQGHDFVHVLDDLNTTASWLEGRLATYFEGNNVLVKVDGYEGDADDGDAVLFSAHFDSAPTAPGATDDGMSVAALLQVLTVLVEHQPRRTAVFNINNGEENGLSGAHVFVEHPWSELTSTFMNLEGAGSGGRPLLFRASSVDTLQAFTKAYVPHPHANALTADAFSRGVVRSRTDYSVYTSTTPGGRMRGADVAFYKNRARYHTPDDSIRGMGRDGARRALWALLEIVRGAGGALLNEDAEKVGVGRGKVGDGGVMQQTEGAVYFELYANFLIVFAARILLAVHISLLAGGPILVAIFAFLLYRQSVIAQRGRARRRWVDNVRGYGRFWLALFITLGAQIGLVVGFIKLNPYTIHANAPSVVLSIISLAYLTLSVPLSLAQIVRPVPPAKQKLACIFSLYALTWIFLVFSTVALQQWNVSGMYWVGAWNACTLVGAVIGAVEGLVGSGKAGREVPDEGVEQLQNEEQERGRKGRAVRFSGSDDGSGLGHGEGTGSGQDQTHSGGNVWEGIEHNERAGTTSRHDEDAEEATETTPLMSHRVVMPKSVLKSSDVALDEELQDRALFWWILEGLFEVPVPVTLLGSILFLWVGAMSQTVLDGGWVGIVYIPLSLLCVLVVLPLAPFAHKMHSAFTILVFVLFLGSTLYAWLMFPFDTRDARCKVYFSSRVELANFTVSSSPTLSSSDVHDPRIPGGFDAVSPNQPKTLRTVTQLTGVPEYIERIIAELPSSWGKKDGESKVSCMDDTVRKGLRTCEWDVEEDWKPAPVLNSTQTPILMSQHVARKGKKAEDLARKNQMEGDAIPNGALWMSLNATRLDDNLARFIIQPTNSRHCRIHLDGPGNVTVTRYRVLNTAGPSSSIAHANQRAGRMSVAGLEEMIRGTTWHDFEVPGGRDAGVREVGLWSRTWGREFVVEIEWHHGRDEDVDDSPDEDEGKERETRLGGRVACEWDEYGGGWAVGATSTSMDANSESEMFGDENARGEERRGAHIPALEEVLEFLPEWAIPTASNGLVEVVGGFLI